MRFPLIACFAWLGLSAGAFADEETARRHYLDGRKAYAAEEFAHAATEFEAAIAASPRPELYYNLGKTYDKLGKGVKAVASYRRYLQSRPDAEDRATIEDLIRRDVEQAGHLDLRVDVADGRVKVDGELIGSAPLVGIFDLDPGAHQLVIEKEGALPRAMQVAVAPGQTVRLELPANTLVAPAPSVPNTTSSSSAITNATAASSGGPTAAAPTRSRLRLPAWILLGVAGAALAGGIGFGVAAHQEAATVSNASSMKPPLPFRQFADNESRGQAFAAAGYAFDAIAAAAAVADVVLWVMARREETRSDRR